MILSRLKPAFYGRAGRKNGHPIGEHSCTLYSARCSVIESTVKDKFLGMKNSIIFISALSLVAMMLASCESVFAPDESATTGTTSQIWHTTSHETPPPRPAEEVTGG